MKYNLSTAEYFYTSGSPTHSTLLKLGFKFEKTSTDGGFGDLSIDDEAWPTIEINTLEELRDLENLVGYALVISDSHITIYNDYLE